MVFRGVLEKFLTNLCVHTSRLSSLRMRLSRRFASSAGSSLASLVISANQRAPALIAPQQNVSYTYEELDLKARCLASGLEDIGYKPGSVALSDVPNVAENILLQLALSHVGAAIMTPPKDAAALDALLEKYDVCGIICVEATAAWLEHTEAIAHHRMPIVSLEAGDAGPRPASATVDFRELLLHCPPRGGSPVAVAGSLLGVYGGSALTHGEAITLGRQAATKLHLTSADVVCASITLMHAFGIGSAVSSALTAGASVVLPAVGGIRGCGVPAQRATVTVEVLERTGATVLFGDTHTLQAMRELGDPPGTAPAGLKLRSGVIKVGSGSNFLDHVAEVPSSKGGGAPMPLKYGGVAMLAMGKA